jgi:hypothetical protein
MYIQKNKSEQCIIDNCKLKPIYNYKAERIKKYCKNHKNDEMIRISSYCRNITCLKQPSFNYNGNKNGLYCSDHKKENMIDIKNINKKTCKYENCNKIPGFNYKYEKSPLYCKDHKKDNMISKRKRNKCKYNNCDKYPNYNYSKYKSPKYCNEHKKSEMIMTNKQYTKCIKCEKSAIYNLPNNKQLYCIDHKKENMIDVKNIYRLCHICNYITANPKLKDYCVQCYVYKYPNSEYANRYIVRKQDKIHSIFKDISIIQWDSCDKKIEGTCNKRRPDYFKDLFTHCIILEIDENQHKNYNKEDEIERLKQLYIGLGKRKLVVIRFNPDSYIKNNKKYNSMFSYTTKNGFLKINEKMCRNRLKIVNTTLSLCVDYNNVEKMCGNNKEVIEIKLYYDS